MLTRTIYHYREKTKETLVSTCGLFGVNRQAYYRRKKGIQKRQETADQIVRMVTEVRQQMPRIGTRKLYYRLQDQLKDLGVSQDKLFAFLKANHMLKKPQRSYQITTDSHHRFRKYKSLIKSLTPERPEQIWASDITYIGNLGNHRYLALVTDTYSKKIVGYDLSTRLGADGSIKALKMGLKQEFLLEEFDVKFSVMKELVKNSIGIYYKKRPHYSGYMKTPEQMHSQDRIKIRSYKRTNRTRVNPGTVSKSF